LSGLITVTRRLSRIIGNPVSSRFPAFHPTSPKPYNGEPE
jgi:hypothetical protein